MEAKYDYVQINFWNYLSYHVDININKIKNKYKKLCSIHPDPIVFIIDDE